MKKSLVVCLALSTAAAATVSGLCLAAGGGVVLAAGAYVGTGSLALTGLAFLAAALGARTPRRTAPARRPAGAPSPA